MTTILLESIDGKPGEEQILGYFFHYRCIDINICVHPFYLWLNYSYRFKNQFAPNIATFVAKAIEENG